MPHRIPKKISSVRIAAPRRILCQSISVADGRDTFLPKSGKEHAYSRPTPREG